MGEKRADRSIVELEQLRQAAHDAPMNKVGMTHKGHRFLATHSMAWAKSSREYFAALSRHGEGK